MPEVLPPAGVLYDSPFSFWCWPPPRPVSSFLSSTPRVLASCLELRYSLQRGHPLSPSCVLPPLLQNFYKSEINKEEMYIRYIHKLCDMHLQAENYTGKQEGRARPPPGKGLDRHAQLTGESSELGPARCQQSVSAHDAHPLTPCPQLLCNVWWRESRGTLPLCLAAEVLPLLLPPVPPHLRVTSRSREPGSEPPELFVAPREQSLSEDLTAGLSEATAQALRLTRGPPERAGRPALWSGLFPCSHPAAPH